MITEERVMTLFAGADPVPDVEELELVEVGATSYLTTLTQRSSEVTQLETKPTEPENQKRSMMPWLVAALAALILGVAITFLVRDASDVAEPTPTTNPERTPTTVLSEDADMALALGFADAMYVAGGDALAALPWGSEETSNDVTWVSEFAVAVNSEVVESSCQRGSITIVCKMTVIDDISKTIGEETSYGDIFTLRFDDSSEEIVSAQWRTSQTGDLADFYAWTQTNSDLHSPDGVCRLEVGRPAECALALLDLTDDYLADS